MRTVLIGLCIWALIALPFAVILLGAMIAGRRGDAQFDAEKEPSSPESNSENGVTSPSSSPDRRAI